MNHLDTVRILPLILELFLSTHLRGLEENVVMIYPCFSVRAGPSQGCRSGQAAAHTCTKHGLSACCVLHPEDGQGPGLSCRISPELWAGGPCSYRSSFREQRQWDWAKDRSSPGRRTLGASEQGTKDDKTREELTSQTLN